MVPIDFETYSEAGYYWDDKSQRWRGLAPSKPGISGVGAVAYSEHPSAEVISLAYRMPGEAPKLWVPGLPNPEDLFNYLTHGGLVSAFNSLFEYFIWWNVCIRRYGWPQLDYRQMRDTAANCRHWSIPHNLKDAAKYVKCETLKIEEGKSLIQFFSVPRSPTKNNIDLRNTVLKYPEKAQQFYKYNVGDIITEDELRSKVPDLSSEELNLWLVDQAINIRGVPIDTRALDGCMQIIEAELRAQTEELKEITGGRVNSPSEVKNIVAELKFYGVKTDSIDKSAVKELLDSDSLHPTARKILEIRKASAASSVKKTGAIKRMMSNDGRLRAILQIYGADKTDRWAGRGPQPQNLPNSGPMVKQCVRCKIFLQGDHQKCLCGAVLEDKSWCQDAVEQVLENAGRLPYRVFNNIYRDPLAVISGSLRGLFCGTPDKEFICSDYSAIEAVCLAALAGEEWRLEVFRTHGMIYEMSASKITGVPFEEFVRHKKQTGEHHPLRKKIGKIAELASGYQGWVGSWRAFGADKHFGNDEEIKQAVIKWRTESPAIVSYWYDCENAAISAIQNPGNIYDVRGIKFQVREDVLYLRLFSGRELKYHQPRVHSKIDNYGRNRLQITFMGNNKDRNKGPYGWTRLETYGGSIVESITQSTARDILAHAIVNLEGAGYPVVLHVHDEIVSEVTKGRGSIEEFEAIMATLPHWCADWPLKASGGWRGRRYRK